MFLVFRIRHILIAVFTLVLAFLVVGVGKNVPAFNVSGREIPIYSVERDDNRIALTFDCAWNDDDIDEILEILDTFDAKATFFVVGDWVNKYPESLIKIYEGGHQIGTHSMSHTDYTTLSAEEIMRDINACEDTVMNLINDRPVLVRAPSGAYNDTVVKTIEDNHRIYLQWSVDALDYPKDATEESIFNRVIGKTKAGDIILMHNGTENTVKVLPRILEELSKDYKLVKALDLIYHDNYRLDNTGRQFKK